MGSIASESTWQDFYYSDLQSPWALWVIPLAFLVYRAVRGRPAGCDSATSVYIWSYGLFWAIETMVDPLCTGPVSRALAIDGTFAGTVVMFTFVLLGDLRVFALLFGVASGGAPARDWLGRACAYTLVVPLFAGSVYGGLGLLVDELHGQVLWLAYEVGFLAMAVYLAHSWIPAHIDPARRDDGVATAEMLKSCVAFSAVYYALWAAADVAILAGVDEAWALRVVPNQLYYAWWVPFATYRYFAAARAAS